MTRLPVCARAGADYCWLGVQVHLPRVGADIRLSVVMFEGPVEDDWLNFYGRPADGSMPHADTLVVRNVPAHWFDIDGEVDRAQYFDPSSKLRSTFAQFGDIRDIDVQV